MVLCFCPHSKRSHINGAMGSKKQLDKMVSMAVGTKADPEAKTGNVWWVDWMENKLLCWVFSFGLAAPIIEEAVIIPGYNDDKVG